LDISKMRLYPKTDGGEARTAAAGLNGVGVENIFCANGSDEALAFAFYAFFEDTLLMPEVTYSFYPVYADFYGLEKEIIPLTEDFSMDVRAYKKASDGIVICNPNAPTSISVPRSYIYELAECVKGNILVDEAYIDFTAKANSLARYAPKFKNMLVVKTLSKSYSLAGLRCGYAVGCKELIDGLNRVKNCFNSYTMDMLCQSAALAAVTDREYFDETVKKIIATRERGSAALSKSGHKFLPSEANFLLVKHKKHHGEAIYKVLKENGILVRYFAGARTAPFVRVTVGTDAEMDRFLEVFNDTEIFKSTLKKLK
jgi:histidinol-phosphate aminotransferase